MVYDQHLIYHHPKNSNSIINSNKITKDIFTIDLEDILDVVAVFVLICSRISDKLLNCICISAKSK